MIKLLIFVLLIATDLAFGQVGINTTQPTETLDVNGTARIRSLSSIPNGSVLVADSEGVIGVGNSSAAPFVDGGIVFMENGQSHFVFGSGFNHNNSIPLGLSLEVVVPADRTYLISLEANVSIYPDVGQNTDLAAYVGLSFFRNGVPVEGVFSKERAEYNNTTTVGGTYPVRKHDIHLDFAEVVTGAETIVYEVRGVAQQFGSTGFSTTYRFGQTGGTNPCCGEGKGRIKYLIIEKQ